jgi:hypothetical protein
MALYAGGFCHNLACSLCHVCLPFSALPKLVSRCKRFILPDYPHTTKFLTPEERTIAVQRLSSEHGSHDKARSSLLSGLILALKDYKLYLLA